MVPSSLTISQITPAGYKPARRREIDSRLGLAAPFEDTARSSAKRENVARPGEVAGHTTWINGGLDRFRPIGCRDARCHAGSFGNRLTL